MPATKLKACFIEPMLLNPVSALPDDRTSWLYQLKLDGYRAIAIKSAGVLGLRSRNDNDFGLRYLSIAKALSKLPNDTVIDGEIVALGEDGRPSFNLLQNHGSTRPDLFYYAFDVMILAGKDVRGQALDERLSLLGQRILPKLAEPVRPCVELVPTWMLSCARCVSSAWKDSSRSGATACTNPACAPVLGRRCGSTKGRNW